MTADREAGNGSMELDCPWCGYHVRFGLRVCQGCHSDVVYGATRRELASAIKLGFLLGRRRRIRRGLARRRVPLLNHHRLREPGGHGFDYLGERRARLRAQEGQAALHPAYGSLTSYMRHVPSSRASLARGGPSGARAPCSLCTFLAAKAAAIRGSSFGSAAARAHKGFTRQWISAIALSSGL
jgi:hypothetical protein